MIVYWTEGKVPCLYFLVRSEDGLTRTMHRRAHEINSFDLTEDPKGMPMESSYRAWISRPYGFGAPVDEYGSVLMIATGIGIAAQLPYLKELIWDFNHCETQTRRIHLIWELEYVGEISVRIC